METKSLEQILMEINSSPWTGCVYLKGEYPFNASTQGVVVAENELDENKK